MKRDIDLRCGPSYFEGWTNGRASHLYHDDELTTGDLLYLYTKLEQEGKE